MESRNHVIRILFICLGNICRSTAAQGVMQQMVDDAGVASQFSIDSAGIGGWHVGQLADPRMRAHARQRGYELTHRARQFDAHNDFDSFDMIVTMDDDNYRQIVGMARTESDKQKVVKMADYLTFHRGVTAVPDPYYGGDRDFEYALDLIEDGCRGLLQRLSDKNGASKPRLVILDFDGTMADTNALITNTMQATLRELHLPEQSREACATTIGLPLEKCFSALIPMNEEMENQCAAVYRRIFKATCAEAHVQLFPHVLATLRQLHDNGILLSIASSRSHASLQHFVDDLQLNGLFGFVLGGNEVERAKPDPEPVLITLSHFQVSPEETLVVGDMTYDILMGRRAGCRTCGVSYGNGSRQELLDAGADRVVDDFADILCQ